jgi:TolA-binding protein
MVEGFSLVRRASAIVTVPVWRALVVCALVPAAAMAQAQPPSITELTGRTETAAGLVKSASNDVELVERQYTLVEEPSDEAALLQRYSDAEIRKLLGDYATASVLFYDLVANKDFQKTPRYVDALYYLADSLYEMKNYLGARLYLRQLLDLRGKHYKEALARYLEIAGR